MKKFVFGLLSTFFLASPVFAAGYGDAGCGLGSMVFGDSPGFVQIFAATTNGTSYNQAFGITTGTSNCDASGVILAEREKEIFVANNYSSLAKEMAAGEGEGLYTLAGLLGCSSEGYAQFGSMTQQSYQQILAGGQAGAQDMLAVIEGEISRDPVLSASCIR